MSEFNDQDAESVSPNSEQPETTPDQEATLDSESDTDQANQLDRYDGEHTVEGVEDIMIDRISDDSDPTGSTTADCVADEVRFNSEVRETTATAENEDASSVEAAETELESSTMHPDEEERSITPTDGGVPSETVEATELTTAGATPPTTSETGMATEPATNTATESDGAQTTREEKLQLTPSADESWDEWNSEMRHAKKLRWPEGFDGWEHALNLEGLPTDIEPFTGLNTQTKEPQATLDYKCEKNDIIRADSTGKYESFRDIHWLIDHHVQTPVLTLDPLAFPTNKNSIQETFDRLKQDGSVMCRFEYIDGLSVCDNNYAVRVPAALRKPAGPDTVYIKPGMRYVAVTSAKMFSRHAAWLIPLTKYQDRVGYPIYI